VLACAGAARRAPGPILLSLTVRGRPAHHQRELPARPPALRPDHPRAGNQRTTSHQPGSRRDSARIPGHRHAL